MPEKVGQPLVKDEIEKKKDERTLEEIKADQEKEMKMGETDTHGSWDPLAEQAARLPNSVQGADGFLPDSHVQPVSGTSSHVEPVSRGPEREEFSDDEDLGGGLIDPDELTAD